MSIEPSTDDVFEMAEQIEHDACSFYRQAAASMPDPACRSVLLDLASMEGEHEQVFATIKAQPAAPGGPGPGLELADGAASSWPSVAQLFASGVREDLARRFTGRETRAEILQKAIEFEKDSLAFFLSARNLLTDPEGRRRIDALLNEELGHILTLTGRLASPM